MTGTADGDVVWVTGAGGGMGRAAAEHLARSGRRVVLTGRRAERLDDTAASIRSHGGEALVLPGDVGDAVFVGSALDRILQQWDRVDALVLAAGTNRSRRTWADQDMGEFEAVVRTNLLAIGLVVDAALPALRRRGGTVVVVSSYSAWTFASSAGVAYSASKAALAPLCRMINAQEGDHGIRATHLCPGDVDTDLLDQRPTVPDAAARAVMLTPDDVARAIAFVLDAPPHVRIDELVVSPLSQR